MLLEKDESLQITGEVINEPEFNILINSTAPDKIESETEKDFTDTETQRAVNEYFAIKTSKSSNSCLQKNKPKSNGILPSIFDSLENPSKNLIYHSLSKAGYICSGSEFLKEEV